MEPETESQFDHKIDPWGMDLRWAGCQSCHKDFLLKPGTHPVACPSCRHNPLELFDGDEPRNVDEIDPSDLIPEQMLPFNISRQQLLDCLRKFLNGLWFVPQDLKIENLFQRLVQMNVPVWLVDCSVKATWRAETGFNYQVVSHKDRFNDRTGGWVSKEVNETRLRWEKRLGNLERSYVNVTSPAMSEDSIVHARVGAFDYNQVIPYGPDRLLDPINKFSWAILVPDLEPAHAWLAAEPKIMLAAQDEVKAACSADAIRDFEWTPEYENQNWTMCLLPVLTTFYVDDQGVKNVLWINGQTGRLSGKRKASMVSARKYSVWALLISIFIFAVSLLSFGLGLLHPMLVLLGGIGIFTALVFGVFAILPIVIVWFINRNSNYHQS